MGPPLKGLPEKSPTVQAATQRASATTPFSPSSPTTTQRKGIHREYVPLLSLEKPVDQSLPQQEGGGGRPLGGEEGFDVVGEGERNEAETESAVWWVLKSALVVLM